MNVIRLQCTRLGSMGQSELADDTANTLHGKLSFSLGFSYRLYHLTYIWNALVQDNNLITLIYTIGVITVCLSLLPIISNQIIHS